MAFGTLRLRSGAALHSCFRIFTDEALERVAQATAARAAVALAGRAAQPQASDAKAAKSTSKSNVS